LKSAKLEELVDMLFISTGQVYTNDEKATDKIIKECAKILGHKISVTNFTDKNLYFLQKIKQ
jgi:ABC-type lipoprotein release transport system permease subunit